MSASSCTTGDEPEKSFPNDQIEVLAADFVVLCTREHGLEVRDRRTNERVFGLPSSPFHQMAAAVRRTIYRSIGPIVDAWALDGTLLWTFDAGERVARLMPFGRHLVLQVEGSDRRRRSRGGGVICLGENA
jgi:hypothetical protein